MPHLKFIANQSDFFFNWQKKKKGKENSNFLKYKENLFHKK